MTMQPFDYIVPGTLDEAVRCLDERPGAQLLAGGQTLLLRMQRRQLAPSALIDLRNLPALRVLGSRAAEPELHVGAMVTCMELAENPLVLSAARVLSEAAQSIGDVHVRNRATIGGHLGTAAPASDLAPVVVVLGGRIHVRSPYRERVITAEGFFTGPFDTSLERNELITEITFTVPPGRSGGAYEKVEDPANGSPICGVAAFATLSSTGNIGVCRVAATGITTYPARLAVVEATLEGAAPNAATVRAAASHAGRDLNIIGDAAAPAEFRAHLLRTLTEKAINRALRRAQSEPERGSPAERARPQEPTNGGRS